MDMIRVVVQLHTIAQKKTKNGRIDKINLEISNGSTILDIIERVDIPLKFEDLLVVIEQKTVAADYQPQDGDIIHIIPAISGG